MRDEHRDALGDAIKDVAETTGCLWQVIAIIGVVLVALLAGGCSGAGVEAQTVQDDALAGRFEWHETGLMSTYVLVDRETGVCYVARYKCGLSVMVDADGEPVTVDEIGGDDGASDR